MKCITNTLLAFTILLALYSCNSTESKLIGSWHVVRMENPYNDSFLKNTQIFIDTMGKGHDDALNIQLYGVANMDSMRSIMQKQYDSAKLVMINAYAKTTLTLKKGGVVEMVNDGESKEGKWLIDNDNALIIEEEGFGNPGGLTKCRIIELTNKKMMLRFYQDSDSSTITFEPERNKEL
jgi:hypothetical protein